MADPLLTAKDEALLKQAIAEAEQKTSEAKAATASAAARTK